MKTIILSTIILCFAFLCEAQETRQISGYVVDDQGYKLQGVSVQIKESTRGTITDYDGKYQIEVLPQDKYLVFSFVGMETQQVKIGKKKTINVKMVSSILELEECVAVGYGSIKPQAMNNKRILIRGASSLKSFQNHYYIPNSRENYASINENGFKNVMTSPLSTFSIDVDNASYSNVRRFINNGMMPPADAIRIEEMINYFTYDYPEPKDEHPFSINTELGKCPWNEEHKLLHIGLQGKNIQTEDLPPSNLVFLLDVSGSMQAPNKLPLVKRAFRLLVNELRPSDKVSIVVYAGAAGIVLEPTSGNEKNKIIKAIDNLSAGGSTAGGQGILLAYKTAKKHYIEGGNNRVILATDGDFNVGVSTNSELEDIIERERENGVALTVLGFGQGNIQDDKMEMLANKGNGNYAYIDNFSEARKVFISEFGGTLFTIAKDVKLQLEFNPKVVKAYRLIGYENRLLNDEDFNDDKKDAGEIGAGHTVTALYEIVPNDATTEIPSVDPLKYQQKEYSKKNSEELLTIKIRYKKPEGHKSILLEQIVKNKAKVSNSDNFNFSASVAAFGMTLRKSDHRGSIDIDEIIKMAAASKGVDREGYRSEFIQLVRNSKHFQTTQILD